MLDEEKNNYPLAYEMTSKISVFPAREIGKFGKILYDAKKLCCNLGLTPRLLKHFSAEG